MQNRPFLTFGFAKINFVWIPTMCLLEICHKIYFILFIFYLYFIYFYFKQRYIKNQDNPAGYLMPFTRYCKVVFWVFFGHIPEQTHLKPWYKYKVFSKVCMHLKNPDNQTYYFYKITDLLCWVLWACSVTLT